MAKLSYRLECDSGFVADVCVFDRGQICVVGVRQYATVRNERSLRKTDCQTVRCESFGSHLGGTRVMNDPQVFSLAIAWTIVGFGGFVVLLVTFSNWEK